MPPRRRNRLSRFIARTCACEPRPAGRGALHDIPNQRVDRSIQVTLRPGVLEIDYEVSLTELTLTQDLRALIGSLPGGERPVAGSLWPGDRASECQGFLVSVDGKPVTLAVRGYDLVVEEHPRYTFHFEARIAGDGRLAVRDTNYVSSEGTSRLAVRGRDGVMVDGRSICRPTSSRSPFAGLAVERRRRAPHQAGRGPLRSATATDGGPFAAEARPRRADTNRIRARSRRRRRRSSYKSARADADLGIAG